MDEQEATDQFEDMCGGPNNAFRLRDLYIKATQTASGNRSTTSKMPSSEELFHKFAKSNGFTDRQIDFYLSHFV